MPIDHTFELSKKYPSLLIAIAIVIFHPAGLQAQDVQHYYSQAKEACATKDFVNCYDYITQAKKLHPYHPLIGYQLGIAAANTGRSDEALSELKKVILMDAQINLMAEEFNPLRAIASFKEIITLQKHLQKSVVTSDTLLVVPNKDSHFESLACDTQTGTFFFGSINKRNILARDTLGNVTEFIKPGAHGITSIFDLQIDEARSLLWACSSPVIQMNNYDSTLHSVVYQFDLSSGALLNSFESKLGTSSVFGDLTINSKGNVFVSDGKTNTIFEVNEDNKSLEPYFTSSEFWNIQGIAFSNDDQYLFIADYIKGPYRLDTSSKQLLKIEMEVDESFKGIDGLLYFNHSLIAIQNGVSPNRVVRYFLNDALDKFTDCTTIDRAHPAFNEPTMGYLVGNRLFYIANSSWGAYDENFNIKPALIQDVVILTYPLEN